MAIDPAIRKRIIKNALLSLFIYALPVVTLFAYLKITGKQPWNDPQNKPYFKQIDKYKK
jgi:hypothetical protein